ncbi:hypothetical protein K501DRAFT_336863 [Backusella circina FSU 941]|nr:hypothetical protein K501DRAFT_336863 [Backusella circina FSU 941]
MKTSRNSHNVISQKKSTQEQRKRNTSVTKATEKKTKSSSSSSNKSKNKKYSLCEQAFPFQASRNDLSIDFNKHKKRPLAKGTIQFIFEAHYKSIPVSVVCLYKSTYSKATNFRKAIYDYELDMSDRLVACRGMNTHLFSFEAPMKSQHRLPGPNAVHAYCMVLPSSNYVILKDYIEKCETKYKNEDIEPIHLIDFVKIAISLFAMLQDAHLQRIGLGHICAESLKIGVDQTLYFDDFKSCLDLDVPPNLDEKHWIQIGKFSCPEKETFKEAPYHESADVYHAAMLLVQLIKEPKECGQPVLKLKNMSEVIIISKRIRSTFNAYEDILKRCLSYDPKLRPTAAELLSWFEKQRRDSFSVA